MKFSIIAAVSAIVLAGASDAASLKVYNLQDHKGDCGTFLINKYDVCYTISEFYLPRSTSFYNADPNTEKLSLTFFETGNCGGKYFKVAGSWKTSLWYLWGNLGSVNGIAGSVMLQKGGSGGGGTISQYKPAEIAKFSRC
ncbi:hypothetical protein BGZ70_005963 [Mortierella alpina]|uniref:Uncharacterized protein n=1 Tax=Mortierella alpina TaxID=64518 RepID=A0A9P6J8P7_MORAP|nr:hypothetical protein BGZ70_005963 [Mortierella alpina]